MSSKSSFYNSTGVTNTQSNAIDASVNNAEASAVASATSATSSEDSSISSGNSATASANSAIASASSATSSETARNESVSAKDLAQTAATESSASAVASENSKLAANVSAVQANTSASTANSAVTNANLQRGLAETAKTAAETAQTAAETALDEFTDIYLGSKTSAPTTDNDGNALVAGAIYWHSTNGQLYIWNGSAWNNAAFDASGTVTAFNSRTGSVTLSSADVIGADGLLTTGGSMSGDLLVGGTNALAAVSITGTANDQGIVCGDDGMLQVSTFKSYGGGSASYFNRVNNDGDLIRFNRTGFTKGRIGVDTGELYIDSNALILRHDGDDVLKTTATGINVTGTVTSDGLTVDGSGYVYINTNGAGANPSGDKGLFLSWNKSNSIGESTIGFNNQTGLAPYLQFASWDGTNFLRHMRIDDTGDISFYEDTGTTAKFFWDSSAERLGLGNTAPSSILHLTDTHPSILFETSGGGATDQAYIQKYSNDLYIYNKESAGKIFLGTNNQTKATIDSSGQVGIGTDSPTNVKLQINGSLSGTSGTGHLAFGETSAPFWNWRLNTSTADLILDRSYGGWQSTPVMAFDRSSGSVGIGTTSPSATIDVVSSGTNSQSLAEFSSASGLRAKIASDGGDDGYLYLYDTNDANTVSFRTDGNHSFINGGGNFGIGTGSPDANLHVYQSGSSNSIVKIERATGNTASLTAGASTGLTINSDNSNGGDAITRFTQNSSEAMRIDSSGNLLVGTTDNTPYNNSGAGNGGSALHADGLFSAARDGNAVGIFNRLSSDGDIVEFRKDGLTKVGNIGTIGSDLTIGTGDVALRFQDGSDNLIPHNVSTNSTRDAGINIGTSGARFKDLHLSGSITSGANGGLIKEIGGDTSVVQGAVGLRINDTASAISPTTGSSNNDGSVDLGVSNIRFKDLHLSGDVKLGDGKDLSWGGDYANGAPTIAASSNFIAFYPEGNVSAEEMRITSSGNVGISTSSPDVKLDIQGDTGVRINSNADVSHVELKHSGSGVYTLGTYNYSDGGNIGGVLAFGTNTNAKATLMLNVCASTRQVTFCWVLIPLQQMMVVYLRLLGVLLLVALPIFNSDVALQLPHKVVY